MIQEKREERKKSPSRHKRNYTAQYSSNRKYLIMGDSRLEYVNDLSADDEQESVRNDAFEPFEVNVYHKMRLTSEEILQ